MFPRSAGYAIQALTYLAGQPSGTLSGAREISSSAGIPGPFLWKILRNLSRKKLIRSFKGVRGGYELARPSNKITVQDVLDACVTTDVVETCLLGMPSCRDEEPCPLHDSWKTLRVRVRKLTESTTLADLARAAKEPVKKRTRRATDPHR